MTTNMPNNDLFMAVAGIRQVAPEAGNSGHPMGMVANALGSTQNRIDAIDCILSALCEKVGLKAEDVEVALFGKGSVGDQRKAAVKGQITRILANPG